MKLFVTLVVALSAALAFNQMSHATTIHFTASGIQNPGNAEAWGASNVTGNSAAFELIFDFTATTDAITDPITLVEGGGNGTGMAIVLDNDDLHFWAGNSLTHVFSTPHGLTAPTNDLQLVGALTFDTSGSNDTYELFINGVSLGSTSAINMNNDWAGADGGTGVGQEGGTQRYDGTVLFNSGAVAVFTDGDDSDITFNLYDLTVPGNDLSSILVPEPTAIFAAAFCVCGLVGMRRRGR